MPDEKQAPVIDESEDSELSSLSESVASFDERALRALYQERGFTEAETEALLGPMKSLNETNKKMIARAQRAEQTSFVNSLRESFPYAFDADGKALFSGATKAEMKRAAERLHAHTAALVGASKKTEPARPTKPAADPRAEEWGPPPASSAETVVDRTATFGSWDKMRSDAMHGKATDLDSIKEGVISDIKANGARAMRRRSLGQIAARLSDEAKAAAGS